MEVDGHRKRGRPKLRWGDVIRKHLKEDEVKTEEAQYRRTLILKTRCADPKDEVWFNVVNVILEA